MSVNKYQPHLYILPEDDANRECVVGFLQNLETNIKAIHVLEPAGGWTKVRDEFLNSQVSEMYRYPFRYFVMLIDFDNNDDRFVHFRNSVPIDLQERVFVIGARSEPEELRSALNIKFEEIGMKLAQECYEQNYDIWHHYLLRHNTPERDRMENLLRIIFRR